jgi:serine/threonine-protein kinase
MLLSDTRSIAVSSERSGGPGTGDELLGATISGYLILSRLGRGAQGLVYLARDTKLNRHVALKFLLPQWCRDESTLERFLGEAQADAAARHANLCTIHSLESAADGQPFIVMAYYNGQTLKQRLRDGRLPVDQALEIAAQVADGLAAAHERGIVHRDIKPGNVMLAEDGVKILDFGLARRADSRVPADQSSIVGTGAYMSPEQCRGDSVDARTDVWSTGVMLYEMLAGEPPFGMGNPDIVGYTIRHEEPRRLSEHVRGVSSELEAVVARALRKDPRHRFQAARDLARALRRVQAARTSTPALWFERALNSLRQWRTARSARVQASQGC